MVATTYVSRSEALDAGAARAVAAEGRGYDEGYAKGLADATEEAERHREHSVRRVDQALGALARALETAREGDQRARDEIQHAAPKLAFALLEELLARELALAANPGREAITRVLALDEGLEPATVRLNPGDVEALGDLSAIDFGREVVVVADDAVEAGGALVEIGAATLDAQLNAALARVRAILLGDDDPGADRDRAA